MIFTVRRTITGLAIAFVLGLISVAIFLAGEQQRTRIVDQGSPTQALVTLERHSEFDHWFVVSFTAQGQAHKGELRYPWVFDKISEGQVITVYVDPDNPGRIATADGYSTPLWTPAPGWLAILAVFATFISVVGRLTSSRKRPLENG